MCRCGFLCGSINHRCEVWSFMHCPGSVSSTSSYFTSSTLVLPYTWLYLATCHQLRIAEHDLTESSPPVPRMLLVCESHFTHAFLTPTKKGCLHLLMCRPKPTSNVSLPMMPSRWDQVLRRSSFLSRQLKLQTRVRPHISHVNPSWISADTFELLHSLIMFYRKLLFINDSD